MNVADRKTYAIATIIAVAIAASAFVYKYVIDVPPPLPRVMPVIGEPGSAHTHTSLLIMIDERVVDFCDPKFMLKSVVAHFENSNCYVVHKHARGVTLPTFLKTVGVELSSNCITIMNEEKRCTNGSKRLSAVLNGQEIPVEDLSYYDLRNNDHILINYGSEDSIHLKFKYNQVPPIPLDVNEPLVQ